MPAKPCDLLAFVLADKVFREEGTHKVSVIGTFDSIWGKTYPLRWHVCHLYIAFTDTRPGTHKAKIELAYLDGANEKLVEVGGPVEVKDALAVTEMNIGLERLVFPRPGLAAFNFTLDDEPISSRKLRLAVGLPPHVKGS